MTPDELNQYLTDFVDGFEFTRPGHAGSLARDVAVLQAELIQKRSGVQEAPDGSAWVENSTKPSPRYPQGYKAWKLEKYGWDAPNYRTGQMLSVESLTGDIEITPHEIKIGYGTDSSPMSGGSPTNLLTNRDEAVTDTQKAECAHNPTGGRPARKFFGTGAGDAEKIVELCQENLNEYIMTSPFGVR